MHKESVSLEIRGPPSVSLLFVTLPFGRDFSTDHLTNKYKYEQSSRGQSTLQHRTAYVELLSQDDPSRAGTLLR